MEPRSARIVAKRPGSADASAPDAIKRTGKLTALTDAGIAEALAVDRRTVSQWRAGEATPAAEYREGLMQLHHLIG